MAIAVVLVLLVIGTVAFHVLNPWWFTPIASNWSTMDDTVNLTFWVTGAVFVGVNLFMAYAIVRYRHRKGVERRAEYEPEYRRLEWWLIGLTAVGVAAMLAPGLVVWAKFVTVPDDADVVEAVGQQWSWSFRLPGADGVLGAVDASLMAADNPFGMDPNDPRGLDDVLIDGAELHLPLDRPVKLLLRSKDVLHDFTVPEFRVKMDLVPGMITYMWLTPTRTGQFEILCEELCGTGHFAMRGRVVVDDEAAYQTWLAAQQTYAQRRERPPGDAVAGATQYAVCAACHGAQGEGNQALNAPKLAGLPAWYLSRQLHNFKHGVRGGAPGDAIASQMSAIVQPLDDAMLANVVAHVASLPDVTAPTTVRGDAAAGARRYATCAYCHGARGQGSWSTNAPPLAGRSDWYLARQLQQFREGHRGRHPQDFHGSQMARLSNVVADGEPTADLLSYLNTLR
ncbi:MAG TPA: c-type cytochrome [Steroidobacteraceae bacterium]|nr:c-type cytochrome [Steroidobacteraceae bacterium]